MSIIGWQQYIVYDDDDEIIIGTLNGYLFEMIFIYVQCEMPFIIRLTAQDENEWNEWTKSL